MEVDECRFNQHWKDSQTPWRIAAEFAEKMNMEREGEGEGERDRERLMKIQNESLGGREKEEREGRLIDK